MNVRMRADYFEVFESGAFRPLYFNFVYDLDRRTAETLISHGMAAPLELEVKSADNEEKELKNAIKSEHGNAKSKKSGARNGSREHSSFGKRTKKRSKN